MIKKYHREIHELKKINNTYDQKVQELEKEIEKNKKYLNDYEKAEKRKTRKN